MLKKKDIEDSLEKKGFDRKEGNHSKFQYVTIDGKKSRVVTVLSHGARSRDVHDGLVSAMARQCYLSNKDFNDLVHCPLSREKYEEKLVQSGNL